MKLSWDLQNSCKAKFKVGDEVETRGDMGNFKMKIIQIHNDHYCRCRTWVWGKDRHFNMNCLELRRKSE